MSTLRLAPPLRIYNRHIVNPLQSLFTVAFWGMAALTGVIATFAGWAFSLALGSGITNATDQALAFFWLGFVPMLLWTAVVKYLHTRSYFSPEMRTNRHTVHGLYLAIPVLLVVAIQPFFISALSRMQNVAATTVPLGAAFATFGLWFILAELNDHSSRAAGSLVAFE